MKNSYGVDVDYFRKELSVLLESLPKRTPEDLARYLRTLADVASKTKDISESKDIDLNLKIIRLFSEKLAISEDTIQSNSDIRYDLGSDSLDCVELIMDLEDEFDIEITNEEAEKIKTMDQVFELVGKKVNF